MKIKTQKVIGRNSQHLLFLQGLLQSIKQRGKQQNIPFKIGVADKMANKFDFEIYPNCNEFIAWRVVNKLGAGLWQTWRTEEEIYNTFKLLSLLF